MDESLRIYLNYLLTVRVTFGTLTLISMLAHIADMVYRMLWLPHFIQKDNLLLD